MPKPAQDYSAIASFALACEQLNAFAQTLTESEVYETVRTGADIRRDESGWHLEKWVEAGLDAEGGLWAVWWLELSAQGKQEWLVESHLSVGPEGIFIPLPARPAATAAELTRQLAGAVAELTNAVTEKADFEAEISRHLKTQPASLSV